MIQQVPLSPIEAGSRGVEYVQRCFLGSVMKPPTKDPIGIRSELSTPKRISDHIHRPSPPIMLCRWLFVHVISTVRPFYASQYLRALYVQYVSMRIYKSPVGGRALALHPRRNLF